jgi:hypothetical protein
LALAALLPAEPVAAQNPVGGAVIGATAGAAIAAEAQRLQVAPGYC